MRKQATPIALCCWAGLAKAMVRLAYFVLAIALVALSNNFAGPTAAAQALEVSVAFHASPAANFPGQKAFIETLFDLPGHPDEEDIPDRIGWIALDATLLSGSTLRVVSYSSFVFIHMRPCAMPSRAPPSA